MGQRVSMSSIMGNGNKSEGDSERERWDRLLVEVADSVWVHGVQLVNK